MANGTEATHLEEITKKILDQGLTVYEIVDFAAKIFESAGCPDDFGLQHLGGNSIVFGGCNRLLWNPRDGYFADESYCSERFIKAVNEFNEK